jgi:hypothetical protein
MKRLTKAQSVHLFHAPPEGFDPNCSHCGGKARDSIHRHPDEPKDSVHRINSEAAWKSILDRASRIP